MTPKRQPRSMRVSEFLAEKLARYDVTAFPPDEIYEDEIASVLGAPIRGWVPELFYRYAIHMPSGLNVNWAIMINAYRLEDGAKGDRRRVERIDLCHSEVHVHRFRRSDPPDDELGERRKLISLSAGDEAIVSYQYDVQMKIVSQEWAARLERWIDG